MARIKMTFEDFLILELNLIKELYDMIEITNEDQKKKINYSIEISQSTEESDND